MMTDPIADMIIRIKNAYLANHREVRVPHSRLKEALAKMMSKEGFLGQVNTREDSGKVLVLTLLYKNNQPVLTNLKRVSKPGRRVYVNHTSIPRVLGGLGITIVSTPQGLMTGHQAKKSGIGGEVLCAIW